MNAKVLCSSHQLKLILKGEKLLGNDSNIEQIMYTRVTEASFSFSLSTVTVSRFIRCTRQIDVR
jgi:hypothetical protein